MGKNEENKTGYYNKKKGSYVMNWKLTAFMILLLCLSFSVTAIEYQNETFNNDLTSFEWEFNPNIEKDLYKQYLTPYIDSVSGCENIEINVYAILPIKYTDTIYYEDCNYKDDKTQTKTNNSYPQLLNCTTKSKTVIQEYEEIFDLSKTNVYFTKEMRFRVTGTSNAESYRSCDMNMKYNDGSLNFDVKNDGKMWWNGTWLYSKELNISVSSDYTNEWTFWELDSDILTNANANLSDLRLLEGNTTNINFQIFNASLGETFEAMFGSGVWIGAKTNATSNLTNLTLYYGNTLASVGQTTYFHDVIGFSNVGNCSDSWDSVAVGGAQTNTVDYVWGNASCEGTGGHTRLEKQNFLTYENDVTVLMGNKVASVGGGSNQILITPAYSATGELRVGFEDSIDATDYIVRYLSSSPSWDFMSYGTQTTGWNTYAGTISNGTSLAYGCVNGVCGYIAAGVPASDDLIHRFESTTNDVQNNFMLISYDTMNTTEMVLEDTIALYEGINTGFSDENNNIAQTVLTTGLYDDGNNNISLLLMEGQEWKAWASFNYSINNTEVYSDGFCNFSAENVLQEKYFKNAGTNVTVCDSGCDYTNRTYEVTGLDTEGYIKDFVRFNVCRSQVQISNDYVISTSCGFTQSFSYETISLCSEGVTNLFVNTTDCGGAVTDVNVSIWTTGSPNTRSIVLENSLIGIDRNFNDSQELVWNDTTKTYVGKEREYYEHGNKEQTISCFANISNIQNQTTTYNVTVANIPPSIFLGIISYNNTIFTFDNNTVAYRVGEWVNMTGGCQDDDLADLGGILSYSNGTVINTFTRVARSSSDSLWVNHTISNFSLENNYLDGTTGYNYFEYCNDTSNNVSSLNKSFTVVNARPVVTWLNSSPVNIGMIPVVINWSVSDFEGSTPVCYLLQNGTLNATASNTGHSVNVVAGTYNYTVRCADSLRNSTDKTLLLTYTEGCLIGVVGLYDSGRYDSLSHNVNLNCTNAIVPDSCHYSINAYANTSITNCSNFNVSLHRGSNDLVFSTVNGAVTSLKSITVYGFDKDASVFTYTYLFVLVALMIAALLAGSLFKVPIIGVLVMVIGVLLCVQLAMFSLWAAVTVLLLSFVAGLTMIFNK